MSVLLAEATYPRTMVSRNVVEDPISVLIVAADPILKSGVERQLHAMTDISVLTPRVGCHPDVAVVVADTVDEEVLGLIRMLRKHSLSRIVVVAAVSDQAAVWATGAGANAVLPRGIADGRRLAWVIQKVHRGDATALIVPDDRPEATLSAPTAPSVERSGDRNPDRGGERPLERTSERSCPVVSDRDREVLKLLAEGCDTGEIARTLAYSEPTIKNAIQRLFDLLKAKNRPHAVALAIRAGII